MKNFLEKNKNLLLYFVSLVFLIVTTGTDIFLFQYGPSVLMTLGFKIPAFIISVGFGVFFVIYMLRTKTVKIRKSIYLIFAILVISVLIGTLCSPNTIEFGLKGRDGNVFHFLYQSTPTYKTIFALDGIAFVLLAFIVIFITPSVVDLNGNIIYLMYFFLALVGVGMIYSLIAEGNKIPQFFANLNDPYPYTFISLFAHRNVFGLVLMISIMCIIYMFFRFNKKRILFALIPLLFFMMMTLCKTTIILTAFLLIASAALYAAKLYKESKKQSFILLSCVGALIVLAIIVIFATPLRDKFYSVFVSTGNLTISTRSDIWTKALGIASQNPVSLIFGRGFGQFCDILFAANKADASCPINFNCYHAHNMYIQELGNGGIIWAIALLSLIVFLFYKIIKNIKKENKIQNWFWILVMVVMMVQCMFETII